MFRDTFHPIKKGKVEYTEHVENVFKYRARKILLDFQMHLLERKREEPGTYEKDNDALDISNLNLKMTISYILLVMDVKFFMSWAY